MKVLGAPGFPQRHGSLALGAGRPGLCEPAGGLWALHSPPRMPELPGHKPLSLAQVALSQLATVALCLAPVIWTMAFSHPPSLPSFLPSSFLASENTPGPSCVVAQPPLPKTLTWRLSPGGCHLEAFTWRLSPGGPPNLESPGFISRMLFAGWP